MNDTQAKLAYVRYVKKTFPRVYELADALTRKQAAEANRQVNINGLGGWLDDAKADFKKRAQGELEKLKSKMNLDSFIENAQKIGEGILQYKTQKEILEIQAERAKKGLPPLETSQLAPTVRVQADVDPAAYERMKKDLGLGLAKFQPYILPAIAAAALLLRRRR